jgi:hypothetical protein
MEKAKRIGIDDYMAEQNEKIRMLNVLLNEYNDGRQKSLFCVAVNLLELDDLNNIMTALARETEGIGRPKEKSKVAARLIQTSAERCGIDLKLRKR